METNKYTTNISEVWEEVKAIFTENPTEALKVCSLDLAYIQDITKNDHNGHSWYVGNCVITKKCVKAAHKHLGIKDELVFTLVNDKKHHLEFKIGTTLCKFIGGKAEAICYANNEEDIKKLFSFFYPDEFVDIKK
jgi:hypothetical protein